MDAKVGVLADQGGLGETKQHMYSDMSEGRIKEVEASILNAVDFRGALVGESKVELDSRVGWYKGTFDLGDGECLTKRFENTKATYDWLLSVSHSYKSGKLTEHMRKAHQAVQSGVDLDKAAMKLQDGQSGELAALATAISGQVASEQNGGGDNVTAEFMAVHKLHTVELPTAEVCLHKGSLNTFCTLASTQRSTGALLLGKEAWNGKMHCTQFVLTSGPPEALLEHERVVTRCNALSLVACGLVTVGTPESWTQDLKKQVLRNLVTNCVSPLLVICDFTHVATAERHCYEMSPERHCRPVSVSWTTNPKQDESRRLLYNLCWLDELGTSHLEAATKEICSAMCKLVREKTMCQAPSKSGDSGGRPNFSHFRIVQIPGNGMCCWNAMLANAKLEQFEKIPRNRAHYPLNAQLLREEEEASKQLVKEVCRAAMQDHDPHVRAAARRAAEKPDISPADLEWISKVLQVSIRCTCALEAGVILVHLSYNYCGFLDTHTLPPGCCNLTGG